MTTVAATRPPGPYAFAFVVFAVTLNMLSFGLVMPVMPSLLEALSGETVDQAARHNGWMAMAHASANFIAMPFLGALSDRFGRRPVLLVSIGMLAIDMMLIALAPTVSLLYAARFLAGLFSATVAVANAFVADITPPDRRGRAFGILGAAFGAGFILGPVVGGLLGEIDIRLPFYVAAACAGLNFLFGYYVLPESLSAENRRPLSLARANPFGAARHFAKLPKVAWFILAVGVFQLAHAVYPTTWNFYGAVRYGWTEAEIGLSLTAVGIGSMLSQAVLSGWMIKRIGGVRAAIFGLCAHVIAMVGFAFAGAPWMAYALIFVSALGGVTMPAISTVTSNLTPKNALGELQGAQFGLMSFTLIFSPVLMTQVFATFAAPDAAIHFPGAAFLLAAVITALALVPFAVGIAVNRRAVATGAAGAG